MGNFSNNIEDMHLIDARTMWDCATCFHHNNGKCSKNVWCDAGESYRPAFDKLKIIDAKPVIHGHWFFTEYEFFCCSCCGESYYNGAETTKEAQELLENGKVYNYCPNCGALMIEVEE